MAKLLTLTVLLAINTATTRAGLFNPNNCSARYEDITSILVRFERNADAVSKSPPYIRGRQMRCLGENCDRKLQAAVCFATQDRLSPHHAPQFDCLPYGIPAGFELSFYDLDCEPQPARSIHDYNTCVYKGSCIFEYKLAPATSHRRQFLYVSTMLFLLGVMSVLVYSCLFFLRPFCPQRRQYNRPPAYDAYDQFGHVYYQPNKKALETQLY